MIELFERERERERGMEFWRGGEGGEGVYMNVERVGGRLVGT